MRWFILSMALLFSCTSASAGELNLSVTSFEKLPGWRMSEENTLKNKALGAFVNSCEKILMTDDGEAVGTYAGDARYWKPACHKARGTLKRIKESDLLAEQDEIARHFFENTFTPYAVEDTEKSEGLFTGYFEPELSASRTRDSKFKYPIYAAPKDLKKDVPYLTRLEIDEGALKGRKLEIAYVDDPVKLFFLHVQGSGHLKFKDGSTAFVGFAAKNNRPYTSIGKVLVEMGALPSTKVDAPAIIKWLNANPGKAQQVMEKNESYVFFRELKQAKAIGAQGVELTPFASLAVDKEFIGLGTPLWLDVTLPQRNKKEKPFRTLVIAQDTGTAIKGAVRGDVFFGSGSKAEWLAGQMKQYGRYYMLLPKTLKVAHEKK